MRAFLISCLAFVALATSHMVQSGEKSCASCASSCKCGKTCTPLRIPINNVITTEKCRRYFSKAKCVCGEIVHVPYVEVTYMSVGKCGKLVEWNKVYRDSGSSASSGGGKFSYVDGKKKGLKGLFNVMKPLAAARRD